MKRNSGDGATAREVHARDMRRSPPREASHEFSLSEAEYQRSSTDRPSILALPALSDDQDGTLGRGQPYDRRATSLAFSLCVRMRNGTMAARSSTA